MAGFSSTVSNPNMSGARGDQFGSEAMEKNISSGGNSQPAKQQSNNDSNGAWNAFLNPNAVKMERFDTATPSTSTPAAQPFNTAPSADYSYTPSTPEYIPTFEEIFARIKSEKVQSEEISTEVTTETVEITSDHNEHLLEGAISFSETTIKEPAEKSPTESIVESTTESFVLEKRELPTLTDSSKESSSGSLFFNKEKVMGSAENISNVTTKTLGLGLKGSKSIFGAIKDIWKSYIYMKEKKPDPKAKENAEKAAKRKANKLRFISLLKEGMAIYHAEARKALIELQVKLGVHALGTEDRNRLLGRSRNASFEGNDTVYGIHQTAFAMMEQRKRQKEASKPRMTSRGKASMGQIFTDKNMSGERTAGGNMMSAVG